MGDNVTICPGFSGTVLIFNDMSQKKITVLPVRQFVPFLAWCANINKLWPSAAMCLHIGGQKLALFYLYIRKIAGSQPDHAGGAHDAPPDPQVAPYDSCLRDLVQDCGVQYYGHLSG